MQTGILPVPPQTAQTLKDYAARYETPGFLGGDPSWFMHQVAGIANKETTAFIASALSYGSRKQFMPKIQHLLDLSQGDMHTWVATGEYRSLFALDDSRAFYRLYSMQTMRLFLDALHSLIDKHGTMGAFLRQSPCRDALAAIGMLCDWFATHGPTNVIPRDTTSACKRLCMFMRWMVRTPSPVDLGLWSDFIDKQSLVMPLDTHVLTEACNLGLIESRTASMATARRLTQRLATVFPDDPLKGDFALFGYAVSGQ